MYGGLVANSACVKAWLAPQAVYSRYSNPKTKLKARPCSEHAKLGFATTTTTRLPGSNRQLTQYPNLESEINGWSRIKNKLGLPVVVRISNFETLVVDEGATFVDGKTH
jgi:hypothetical protein